MEDVAQAAFAKLNKYYEILQTWHEELGTIAIALDPRLKLQFYMDGFEYSRE
jgi:hypothetical protein